MKKTYLFCTKLRFYLSEIPPIILLIITIMHNDSSEGLLKLYPLIIFSSACIVFIFMYFFRMISISAEDIKSIGAFSSRDKAVINKDKTLIFTFKKRNKMVVRLYGDSGLPSFNWMKNDEQKSSGIDLFRENAIGNSRTAKKILSNFQVPTEDINALIKAENYEKEYADFILTKSSLNDNFTINIKFTNTI